MRKIILCVALMTLALTASACGILATPTPTPKPTLPPTPTLEPTATPLPPTPTRLAPTATPVPPTPTPVPVQITTKQVVNLRKGPDIKYDIAGKMPQNATAIVLGKNEDGKWLQVAYPDASNPSWIAAAFVTVTGSLDPVAVVVITPSPTNTPGKAAPTKAAAAPTATVPPVPAPKGTIAFITLEGTSYLISNYRFDTKTIAGFKLIGPKPYDLAQFTSAAPFAYMPGTTGDLAFVQGPSENVNNLYVTINGADKSLYTHPGISSPTWSPDGKFVVYVGMDNNFHTQFLYKISKDGGKSDRFFPTNAADIQNRSGETFRGVTWGKTHLLFVSNLTGQYEIWRLNADGNGPLQLTNDKRENGAPAWSPDGTRFAYYSKMADNSYQIMIANADGSNKRQLTKTGNNFSPTWSPDGNWIAFSTDRGGRGFTEIWIVDKNGNNAQSITDKLNNKALTPGSWR